MMAQAATRPRYRQSRRRILIDMQIPDWDAGFLQQFDPAGIVQAVSQTGADGLMLYWQSHLGLCNWPSRSGRVHRAFAQSDVMAQMLEAAQSAGLPVCAYYSVNFNNAAWEDHPDWRLQPVKTAMIGGGLLQAERYGLCCLNHPQYRQFVCTQIGEILDGYAVEAMFFDMVWWMSICVCEACRARYRAETSREIPGTIDWQDPRWCEFQAARERWVVELATDLRDTVRRHRPDIEVYHNFAVALANWTRALSFASADAHDFLGGDFYGGSEEQGVVSGLMRALSPRLPVEFMTTVTANLAEHERLKPLPLLRSQVLTATASGAAFLGILPIDPQGTVNPAALANLRTVFADSASFDGCEAGEPVADIAVYISSDSKMSFADDGLPLAQAPTDKPLDYPHLRAVQGACRILRQAHLPFRVITRRQLAQLSPRQVLVLPNVLRMDAAEIAAVRAFVNAGGRLYASRLTSLTLTNGERAADFALADVFGCSFEGIESGRNLYLQPAEPVCAAAIAPERALSHWLDRQQLTGAIRLADKAAARVLMTLTLPFGYPDTGSAVGRNFSSIHSFPPWHRSARPTVVENRFGTGRAIYAATDIESGATASHDALFAALVTSLLAGPASFGCSAPPGVTMQVRDDSQRQRWIVCFLQGATDAAAASLADFECVLRPPPGRRFTRWLSLPQDSAQSCVIAADGCLCAIVGGLQSLAIYAAEYE